MRHLSLGLLFTPVVLSAQSLARSEICGPLTLRNAPHATHPLWWEGTLHGEDADLPVRLNTARLYPPAYQGTYVCVANHHGPDGVLEADEPSDLQRRSEMYDPPGEVQTASGCEVFLDKVISLPGGLPEERRLLVFVRANELALGSRIFRVGFRGYDAAVRATFTAFARRLGDGLFELEFSVLTGRDDASFGEIFADTVAGNRVVAYQPEARSYANSKVPVQNSFRFDRTLETALPARLERESELARFSVAPTADLGGALGRYLNPRSCR